MTSSYAQADEDRSFDDAADDYEPMILNGKRYLCAIPIVEIPVKNETSEAAARAEEEIELARATVRGWELLKDMEGHCMYFISGWWSYRSATTPTSNNSTNCPRGRELPSTLPPKIRTTPSYVLGGLASRATTRRSASRRGRESQMGRGFGGCGIAGKGRDEVSSAETRRGTTCDLTGKERRVEVQVL
jgi:protein OS-9